MYQCSRQIAAFFLGWVFLSSLRYLWLSTFVRELLWKLRSALGAFRGKSSNLDAEGTGEKDLGIGKGVLDNNASERIRRDEKNALISLLCICFTLASLSHFLSLLVYDPAGSSTACGKQLSPSLQELI